jgi:membrane-associated PAP2 superfamily phosphatase
VTNLKKEFGQYRKILLFFFFATALGHIVVGVVKNITPIYTPWDLNLFNGIQPYIKLFDNVPIDVPVGHAFSAGHASGGYCFLSLYFVLLQYRFPNRIYGLLFGLILGLIFGISQQIRGAHFPSHDLVTVVICWYSSLLIYLLFYPEEYHLIKQGKMPDELNKQSLPKIKL